MGDPCEFGGFRKAKKIEPPIRLLRMDDATGTRMMGKEGFVHNVDKRDVARAKRKGWLASKAKRGAPRGTGEAGT